MRQLATLATMTLTIAALTASHAAAQNLLANPGFEDPITSDGPPFVGSWEGFAGGNASSSNSNVMPRNGAGHLALNISGDLTFAGAFQDIPSLSAGQIVTWSLWHKSATDPYTLVSEIRIEWRNSTTDTEVSRLPNVLTAPTVDYTLNSVSGPVPAGADTARVVYAIQSFTNTGADAGTVYVDDASVTVVPEPAAATLVGACLLGLGALRRRRS